MSESRADKARRRLAAHAPGVNESRNQRRRPEASITGPALRKPRAREGNRTASILTALT